MKLSRLSHYRSLTVGRELLSCAPRLELVNYAELWCHGAVRLVELCNYGRLKHISWIVRNFHFIGLITGI